MNTKNLKPYYLTIILAFINIIAIFFISFNYIKIKQNEKIIKNHAVVNKNNQNYLNGLRNIHSGINKISNHHLSEFSDDLVFDSSIEAIVFREMLRKIGMSGSNYNVDEELKVIQSSNFGDMGQITLGYSFKGLTYNKMIELLSLIINNERYDYFNNIALSKNTSTLLVDIRFNYTNLGFVIE